MGTSGYARDKAERKLRAVDRVHTQSVGIATALLADFRDRILRAYARGGGGISVLVTQLLEDLRITLGDASTVAHLRGFDGAVQEAAEYIARKDAAIQRLAAGDAPYVERAVKYHRNRLGLDASQVDGLRTAYGDAAAHILAPGMGDLDTELRGLVGGLVDEGVHVREGRDRILDFMQTKGIDSASPWRAESIFRTQLQMAYSAGDYAADQDPAIQEILWGYEYATVGDDRVRPNHVSMDGVKLPKDDPFWASSRPPNGHACRCIALKVFHGEEGDGAISPRAVEGVDPVPDTGFGFNPGKVYQEFLKPRGRVVKRTETRTNTEKVLAGVVGFPTDPATLSVVRRLGGSTGAELVEDAEGNRFVRKTGSSPEHLREEFQAEELYRVLGVPIPDSVLYETGDGGPVKLSRFIEGKLLRDLPPEDAAWARAFMRDNMASDAFLSNWDVAGLGLDNVIVGANGIPYRIDVGGALRFRAMGAPKGAAFGKHTGELWSLADPNVNRDAASIFGEIVPDNKWGQVDKVIGKRVEILNKTTDPKLRAILSDRLDELERQSGVFKEFRSDKWKGDYSDRLVKHSTGIRAAGIVDDMPNKLSTRDPRDLRNGKLRDEDGKEFDNMRGGVGRGENIGDENNTTARMQDYIQGPGGGNMADVAEWASGQADDSWAGRPYKHKAYLLSQREEKFDEYFWYANEVDPKTRTYRKADERWVKEKLTHSDRPLRPTHEDSMSAVHAASYEAVRKIDMPGNDRDNGRIELFRTEEARVLALSGFGKLTPGAQPGHTGGGRRTVTARIGETGHIKRGIAESFSVVKPTAQMGYEITRQHVPHTRVMSTYLMGRHKGHNGGMFMGDGENEFVAMAHDVEATYTGNFYAYATAGDADPSIETDKATHFTKLKEPSFGPAKRKGKK